jgi:Tfp pilus assembly protein FimT
MKRVRQTGFAVLELVLVVVFLAAVVGLGYVVMKRHNDNKVNTAATQLKDTAVPAAPAVTSTSDLTKAEQTLDDTNTDASSSDINQLDAQVNDL